LFRRYDLGGWPVLIGKAENVLNFRGTERVDRLRIVTDHRDAFAVRFQRIQYSRLHEIRILILVDQHMVKRRPNLFGEFLFGNKMLPVKQQIVVVERLALLLAQHVVSE